MPAAFAVTSLQKRFRTGFGRTESVALDGVDLHDLGGDNARDVDRNGKAHAKIGVGRADEGGIDADEVALQVDERAARIPGIERGVGLDEILELLDSDI